MLEVLLSDLGLKEVCSTQLVTFLIFVVVILLQKHLGYMQKNLVTEVTTYLKHFLSFLRSMGEWKDIVAILDQSLIKCNF